MSTFFSSSARSMSTGRAPSACACRISFSDERTMNVAAAVAQLLKREGVKFLIAYPTNQLIESAAEAGIRTIIVRQERVGVHMADAVGRVTSGDTIGVFAM